MGDLLPFDWCQIRGNPPEPSDCYAITRSSVKIDKHGKTNLPAAQKKAAKNSRLQRENELCRRPQNHKASPQQGAETPGSLNLMLARDYRLPGFRVKQLLSAPVVKRSQGLTIKAAVNDLTHPRFAVVVPKKVARGAVERNRMKRQMMASIQANITDYELGKDYLFLIKIT